jgi:hypothetical protein
MPRYRGGSPFNQGTSKDTGVMFAWGEASLDECGKESLLPVYGAATKFVKVLLKEPVLAKVATWAARGRADDDNVVVGKDGVTEGILAVALFLDATMFNSHCCQQAITFFLDDRSVDIAVGPDCFF